MFARNQLLQRVTMILWLGLVATAPALAESPTNRLIRIVEPYIELRTGPGEGYPVFHVSESGETLELLVRKTDWIRVRDVRGREGWVRVADARRAVNGEGGAVDIDDPGVGDYLARRWEAGFMGGDFDGATAMQLHGAYWWTPNIASEAGISQILGNVSEITLLSLDAQLQPFPAWRLSPYFSLGLGTALIRPKAALVATENRNEDTVQVGLGARYYVSNRYFLRLEYKDYVVFTDRDENEEAQEWKIGLSVFF